MPSPRSPSRRTVQALAFALLALACSWPFFHTLRFWPMTGDPPLWIGRASTRNPDWMRWVFLADHFSWYRPVTALSFTLSHALAGVNPLFYRLTDLALHVLAGAFLWRLALALDPRRRPWLALLAAAVFLAHPGSEEVVPFIARRSYSLAMALGLASLCLVAAATDARRRAPRIAPAGLLLALAFLSNEAAIVLIPVALALAWRSGPRRPVDGILLALPTALAFALHTFVLGGLGGYGDDIMRTGSALESLSAMGMALTGLGWTAETCGPLLLVYAAVSLVVGALAAERQPGMSGLRGGAVLWLLATAALFLLSGLWVERQVYFLQPPLALLLALLVASSLRGVPRPIRPAALPRLLITIVTLPALLLVLGSLLATSPILRGQDAERLAAWEQRQGLLAPMQPLLAGIEGPACVHTVLPNTRRRFRTQEAGGRLFVHQSTRHPLAWARVLVLGRDVTVSDWLYFDGSHGTPQVELVAGTRAVVIPGGDHLERVQPEATTRLEWVVWNPGFALRGGGAGGKYPLAALRRPRGRDCYLYLGWFDGGELVRLGE